MIVLQWGRRSSKISNVMKQNIRSSPRNFSSDNGPSAYFSSLDVSILTQYQLKESSNSKALSCKTLRRHHVITTTPKTLLNNGATNGEGAVSVWLDGPY